MRGLRLQLKAKAAICLAMLFSLAAGVALAGDSTEKLAGPAWIVDGGEAGERFGYALATGDVNGDGYADVIAGAPYYTGDQDEEGRLAVICGSEHGLASAPTWIESGAAWARFGWSVAVGDVNGDGFDDVIVGAPYYTGDRSQAGRVSVYFGSAQGLHAAPAWSIEGGEAHALFGYAVAAADVDGDGRTDVIAGAPYCTQGQHEEGCAYAFLSSEAGLATTPAWHAEGNQADAHLGFALAGVGDVDGDGFEEVLAGAPDYEASPDHTGEGAARLYYGSASGLQIAPGWVGRGDQAGARFGWSVAAGDVDGDGYVDLVVGAIHYTGSQANEGRALVYYGEASGFALSPGWWAEGGQALVQFGYAVAAGDVDGDGYADVIAGAPDYTHVTSGEGRVSVYSGSGQRLGATAAWLAESGHALAYLGWSLAAGDVDGDGYDDVIAGAPYYPTGDYRGRVYVYHGNDLDHDGLPDDWETNNGLDPWNDDSGGDPDGDGLTNAQEFALGTNPIDADSDGDSIADPDEVGDPAAPADTDGDGVIDALDADSDDDAIPDAVEAGDADLATMAVDGDGDGIPDFRDLDSDADGLRDGLEGAGDADGDGVPNYLDLDSDGDGFSDSQEGTRDTDGDGTYDFLDQDDDGDGFPSAFEGSGDPDGDELPNYLDLDADGDGIPDTFDGEADVDGDGLRNYLDLDSDGDGIPDSQEGIADPDGDLLRNYLDLDSDDDGILDNEEGTDDPDGDGVPNYLDLDSDGDTRTDRVEGAGDVDGDGLSNYLDPDDGDGPLGDADGDSILNGDEAISGHEDADEDGLPNYLDLDSDGDGISDAVEAGDDDPATPPVDNDGDGLPDFIDRDSDSDGVPDSVEGTDDPDGDGVPNYLDQDSDGDGILDSVQGTGDPDEDGLPNYLDQDSDGDGIPDSVEGTGDPDEDGLPNYLDEDADGDGIPDAVEGAGDPDGDGIPNYLDDDSNGDGVPDGEQCGTPPNCQDADGDGEPDYTEVPDGVQIYLPFIMREFTSGSQPPAGASGQDMVVDQAIRTSDMGQVEPGAESLPRRFP